MSTNTKMSVKSSLSPFILILLLFSSSLIAATTWTTPNYPSNYGNNLNINSNLSIINAAALTVTIQGELEHENNCVYDYLQIPDEDGNIRKLCGPINESYEVAGSSIALLFHSDSSVTKKGVIVTISPATPNNIPQITSNGGSSTASINLDEGISTATTVTATDSDNDTLTYSISDGNDQNHFNINSSTGLLTFSPVPDFENPTDSNLDNIYNVTVMVDDGRGGSDTQALIITINDIFEAREPGDNVSCDNIGTNNERCSDVNLNTSFDTRFGGIGFAIHGDFSITGSSVMCVEDGSGNCDWNYNGFLYDASTKFLEDSNNANFTLNSASASLKLPTGVTADEIIYARLYWQGHIGESGWNHNSKNEYLNDISGWDNITIETPNGVHNLSASAGDRNWYGWWGKYGYDGTRFMYQANVDVTDIIKTSYANGDTTYTVGNIVSSQGADSYTLSFLNNGWYYGVKVGYWGGWSLIVVYERDVEQHPDQKYKNIAIYDGFDVMFPWSGYSPLDIEIDIDGFLTPLTMPESGFIDSKMAFFGFGGEKNIPRDYFQMSNPAKTTWYDLTNSANPIDGQFNGSITNNGIPITSGRIYNAGMDLDVLDVSDHMSPNQSNTSLKLGATYSGSNADQILPSMIAFSTEIFSPRVCYLETLFYNGSEVSPTNIPTTGSTITTSLIIRNDGEEIVDKAKFYTTFDGNYTYNPNTTLIGNTLANNSASNKILTADNTGLLNIATNGDDTNMSIYLGYGATSTEGGFLNIDAEAKVDFNGTFNSTEFIAKNYSIAYENTDLGLTYNGKIFKCIEFDNSFVYTPPLGAFNVVNSNFPNNSTTVTDDKDTAENALYTQVVNQSFNVKILSLNQETITQHTGGDMNITLISAPDYSSCATNDDQCKEDICAASANEISDMNEDLNIDYSSLDTDNNGIVDYTFTSNKAHKSAVFRITYANNLGAIKHACSLDRFSIKPAGYNIDINETGLIGGKLYRLDINATNNIYNNSSQGYTTNDANLTSRLIIPAGCTVAGDVNSSFKTFSNGQNISYIKTNNIGDYNITIFDQNWTNIDNMDKNGKTFEDCIRDSSSNAHNINGKVGCDINTTQQFSFTPKEFKNTISITNASNGFTYISNDKNMSAQIDITTTARLEDNNTATNYSANCYAKDINTTIRLLNLPTGISSMLFFDDGNIATKKESNTTQQATFSTKDNNFTSGVANLTMRFNFPRDEANALNPFKISKNDFNITSTIDTNGTTGSDFNRSIDQNTTFYYGRVHAPDYQFPNTNGSAIIYYEVYSDQNKTTRNSFSIDGNESIDSINWYVNTLHVSSDGNVTYSPINGVTLNRNTSTNTASGIDTITVTTPIIAGISKLPHKDKIEFDPSSSWLIHNPKDFLVEFYGEGQWAGEGIQGKTVDLNISKRQNKRLDW